MSDSISKLDIQALRSNQSNNGDDIKGDVSMTELTDLHTDCIENILKFLPKKDLFNFADTSKQFGLAVNTVYRQKYAKQPTNIVLKIQQNIQSNDTEINDLKTSLQQFRMFGHLIKNLSVICDKSIKNIDKLYHYIDKNCSEHLRTACFREYIPKNCFSKPFLNLTSLYLCDTTLDGDNIQFGKLFPNLKELKLLVKFTDSKCIETHFKSLKQLVLASSITKESFETVIRLNPQLECLYFHCDYSGKLLEIANEHLVNVETLGICWQNVNSTEKIEILSDLNAEKIYFKNLKRLLIRFEGFDNVTFPQLPINFGSIESLNVLHCHLDNDFTQFLSRHTTVKKLLIKPKQAYDIDQILNAVELYQFIDINSKIDITFAMDLMARFPYIQKFGFHSFRDLNDEMIKSGLISYCSIGSENNPAYVFMLNQINN